jgi:hypothetical protein
VSRISTDTRRFRRTFGATVALLALLCAAFGVLGFLQGPKLSSAQFDTAQAILRGGEQLRLFADQQLKPVDGDSVTVMPAADVTVSTEGAIVSVQFDAPLRYEADYVVTVADVTSAYDDRSSTLTWKFSTGSPPVYYLDRADTPDRPDEIVRTGLKTTERTVVYSSHGIQGFAVVAEALAVTVDTDEGTSALQLVSPVDGGVEPIALPEPGRIDQLRAARGSVTLGFRFTPGSSSAGFGADRLMVLDLDAGRSIVPVAGLDGAPLSITDWLFIPGGVSLVAHSHDETTLLVDTATGATTPLGGFTSLESLSTDASRLGVTNAFGTVALGLADLVAEEFAPSPIDGVTPYPGEFQLLRDGVVQHVVLVEDDQSSFVNLLVADDGTRSRQLFRTIDDGGSIGDFAVSTNDQVVVVEVVPNVETSVSDGRAVDPRSTSVLTMFIDVATGTTLKGVAGFAVQW